METTTLPYLPGKKVTQHLGMVQGSTVRAKHLGRDIMAGLKNLVGGELKGYTELLQESREEAIDRMIAEANAKGADAVLNVRLGSAAVAPGASEMIAYGVAVKISG